MVHKNRVVRDNCVVQNVFSDDLITWIHEFNAFIRKQIKTSVSYKYDKMIPFKKQLFLPARRIYVYKRREANERFAAEVNIWKCHEDMQFVFEWK